MSTIEATQQLEIVVMQNTDATCTQCGKPAFAYVQTEQGRTRACVEHVRLALLHFARAHGIGR